MIEASRKFVCIRIESYESEENQKIVRSHLGGRFENTAFCILDPNGETRLTRSGRSPQQVSRDFDDIAAIAERYRAKGDVEDSRLPDFNSFELALNVASADQRVLVLVTGRADDLAAAEKRLRPVAWGEAATGRFHYDLETDPKAWREAISKPRGGAGIYLIKPDTFGLEGEVLAALDLDAGVAEIESAMAKANRLFAEGTEKKVYSEHVSEGRRNGKKIEMAMPYGEDRDGDGVIDHRGGGPRRR